MVDVDFDKFIDKFITDFSELFDEFQSYVWNARSETFHDGMDSLFAQRVHTSINEHGSLAVAVWERVIQRNGNMYEAGEELLRQLGHSEHSKSHSERLHVLCNFLTHRDSRMRDAAGLGISYMDDPEALPKLRAAFCDEKQEWVRDGFRQVLQQLEKTKGDDMTQKYDIDKMLEAAREVQPGLWQRTEDVARILDPGAFLDNAVIHPPEADKLFRLRQEYMQAAAMNKAQEILKYLGVNTDADWYAILSKMTENGMRNRQELVTQ